VGDDYLSLDEALSKVKKEQLNVYAHPTNEYFWDLQDLWKQARAEDKEIIEKEMLAFLSKLLEFHSQGYYSLKVMETMRDCELLKEQATSEAIRRIIETKVSKFTQARIERAESDKREEQEREREEKERVELLRTEFKKSRERLIQITNGTLKDKSAQEVKKIVDEWSQESLCWELSQKDYADFFSKITFYRILGKPERQQFLSGTPFVSADYYLFYYNCKDGLVQIQISGVALDDNGRVFIEGLNIL